MRKRTTPARSTSSSSGPPQFLDDQEQEELIKAFREHQRRQELWHRKALIALLALSLVSFLFVPLPSLFVPSFAVRILLFLCHDVALLVLLSRHLLSLKPVPPPPSSSLPAPSDETYSPMGLPLQDLQKMGEIKYLHASALVAALAGVSARGAWAAALVIGLAGMGEAGLRDEKVDELVALRYNYKGA